MTNPYYTRAFNALAGSLARARQMINEFELIRSGFDGVDAKIAIALGDLTGALDYSSSTTYAKSDYVRYLGAVYRAKQATTGNLPTNTTYWQQVDIGAKDLTFIAGGIGLTLRASALAFKVDQAGANSPANITLTAYLHPALAGPASFSVVSGTATLTGTGNNRTLTYADMASDSVTIRATVVDGLDTYADDITICKVFDGADGVDGADGLAGLRNHIINGGFDVWQRGASFSSGIATGTYTSDRWIVFATGAAVNVTRNSGNGYTAGTDCLLLTGAASNTGAYLIQRFEARDVQKWKNGAVTVSGRLYNQTGSTISANSILFSVSCPTVADNWASANSRLTTTMSHAAIPNLSWGYVTVTFTPIGYADIDKGMNISLGISALGAGQLVNWSEIQLETGSTATPFEQQPFSVVLAQCQRYCLAAAAGSYIGQANSVSTTALTIYIPTPVSMRGAPSIIGFSGTSTFGLDGVGNFTSTSTPTLNGIGAGICVLAQSGYTGLTAGRPGAFSNSAPFVLSAEL